jgi:hypothetical protein
VRSRACGVPAKEPFAWRTAFGAVTAESGAEVAGTVGDPEQVESELRFLLSVLTGEADEGSSEDEAR